MSAIVILGMHRSGTSLVARMLHENDISMGDRFLPTDHLNSGGYFEDEDFLWINKGLLKASGGDWITPPDRYKIEQSRDKFMPNLKTTLIRKEFESPDMLWGWKDPRTSITAWVYHQELEDPKYLVIHRDIMDIAKSLWHIHEGAFDRWLDLTNLYYERIQNFCYQYSVDYVDIDYDKLVDEELVEDELHLLATFLEVERNLFLPCIDYIRFKNDLT